MNNCPYCGTLNRPSAKFCGSCGKALLASSDVDAPAASSDALSLDDITAASNAAPDASTFDDTIPPSTVAVVAPAQDEMEILAPQGEASDAGELVQAADTQIPEASATQPQENDTPNSAANSPDPSEAAAQTAVTNDSPVLSKLDTPMTETNSNSPSSVPNAETTAQAADDTASELPDGASSGTGAQTPALAPLAVGAELENRFTILEIVAQDESSVTYRARDAWRCPTCEFINEADAVFCSNCGRQLTERGTVQLVERANAPEVSPPPDFVVDLHAYHIQPDVSATAAPAPETTRVRLQFAVASDVGLVRGSAREPNEDSAFVLVSAAVHESVHHPSIGLFIVADGIGGSDAGELASKKAIQVLSDALLNGIVAPVLQGEALEDENAREKIRGAILEANEAVMQLAAEKQNDMGTTVTLVVILNSRAFIANVGDSRTYLLRDAKLAPITQDHSLVASLVSANMIAPEEVYSHPQRNIILRSLGANAELEVDIFPAEGGALTIQSGDRLLLCCDGLWEMVRDFDLESILLREQDLNKAAANMITAANEGGGEDNVTVVLAGIF